MEKDVVRLAANFWNSPWAMNTIWDNGRGASARFYVENEDLLVEVRLHGHQPEPYQAQINGRTLLIYSSGKTGEGICVPLPMEVRESTMTSLLWKNDVLTLSIPRKGSIERFPS